MYDRCLTVFVSMIVLAPVLAKAAEPATAMGPAVGADKKLIKWGADTPVSSWLRDNAAAMEAMWPFDGVVIRGDIAIGGRRAPQHGHHRLPPLQAFTQMRADEARGPGDQTSLRAQTSKTHSVEVFRRSRGWCGP